MIVPPHYAPSLMLITLTQDEARKLRDQLYAALTEAGGNIEVDIPMSPMPASYMIGDSTIDWNEFDLLNSRPGGTIRSVCMDKSELLKAIDQLETQGKEVIAQINEDAPDRDEQWLKRATDQLETGFMSLRRAVQ